MGMGLADFTVYSGVRGVSSNHNGRITTGSGPESWETDPHLQKIAAVIRFHLWGQSVRRRFLLGTV